MHLCTCEATARPAGWILEDNISMLSYSMFELTVSLVLANNLPFLDF